MTLRLWCIFCALVALLFMSGCFSQSGVLHKPEQLEDLLGDCEVGFWDERIGRLKPVVPVAPARRRLIALAIVAYLERVPGSLPSWYDCMAFGPSGPQCDWPVVTEDHQPMDAVCLARLRGRDIWAQALADLLGEPTVFGPYDEHEVRESRIHALVDRARRHIDAVGDGGS